MNNKYTIRVATPLVRPGLSIETSVSRDYLAGATAELLEAVREINGDVDSLDDAIVRGEIYFEQEDKKINIESPEPTYTIEPAP